MLKRLRHWLQLQVLPPLGAGLIKLLGKAIRISSHNEKEVDQLYQKGYQLIIVFWHGQQLMMPLGYRGKFAHILISQHRDGELIYRIINRFGYRSVRGSTTRGGAQALRKLVRLGRQGSDLVITPDGPQGPRHKVHEGVMALAKLTGFPIVPVTFMCSKKKSSPAGTGLWSRIHGVEECFIGATQYGWIPNPTLKNWKLSVAN